MKMYNTRPKHQRGKPLATRLKAYAIRATPAVTVWLRRYWKQLAGLGLAAAAAVNAQYHLASPATVALVGTIAAGLGIALHKRGDPLPPPPDLPPL